MLQIFHERVEGRDLAPHQPPTVRLAGHACDTDDKLDCGTYIDCADDFRVLILPPVAGAVCIVKVADLNEATTIAECKLGRGFVPGAPEGWQPSSGITFTRWTTHYVRHDPARCTIHRRGVEIGRIRQTLRGWKVSLVNEHIQCAGIHRTLLDACRAAWQAIFDAGLDAPADPEESEPDETPDFVDVTIPEVLADRIDREIKRPGETTAHAIRRIVSEQS